MSTDVIRAFKAEDPKIARYLIGTALMTPLALANSKACMHPLTIAIWIGLTSIMIQLLDWWPTTSGPGGIFALLLPLPVFAAVAVPIMFFFDWSHRPIFEDEVHRALVAEDMREPLVYYSRSPASGFYILEHAGKAIGLIAIDASPGSSDHPSVNTRSSKSKTKTSAETAVVRHFHVEEIYRTSGVQSDLLEHAVSRAFASPPSSRPRKVMAMASTLDKYKLDVLRVAGFRPTSDVGAFAPREWRPAFYSWQAQWFEVTCEDWLAKRQ